MEMENNTKAQVEDLLKGYPQRAIDIALLQYELQHPGKVSENEQIEAMNYARGDGIGHMTGRVSDKTMLIALHYKERIQRLNVSTISEIKKELVEKEEIHHRLDYYISLLSPRQQTVIRLLYVERVKPKEIALQLEISTRTVDRIKDSAIERIAQMYEYAAKFQK